MVRLRLWYAILFSVITVLLFNGGFVWMRMVSNPTITSVKMFTPWGEQTLDNSRMMLFAVTLIAFAILGVFHTISAFATWNLCRKRRKYEWVQFLSAVDVMVIPLGTIVGFKTLSWLADDEVKDSFEKK